METTPQHTMSEWRGMIAGVAVLVVVGGGMMAVASAVTHGTQPTALIAGATETSKKARGNTPDCDNLAATDRFRCYEKYYSGLVHDSGVKTAFEDLHSRYESDSYVRSQCHPLTHVIGRKAAEAVGTVAAAFAQGDSFCWSGYYHGVMETIIGEVGRSKLPADMDGICASLAEARRYSFDHYNCAHGLGHGVMAITNTELFDSLELCNNLTDSWERSSCWSGVFMENVIVDGKNHFTKYLKKDEPLYPCTAVEDQYKTTCYLMQTSYMLKTVGYDFKKVFALCGQAGGEYAATCYQSLGRDASGQTISDVGRTKELCLLGPTVEARSNCVIGAVKDFISYHHSDVQAKELCVALPFELQSVCGSTTASYYKSF